MGGCASKPKELDGSTVVAPVENSVAEPEVTVNPMEADAPKEEVKTETTTESKEAPLVDLSSPKAEDVKSPVSELAPEIKQLTTDDEPVVKAEPKVVKEDAAPEQNYAPAAEEKDIDVKAVEVKEPVVVAGEKKISA